MTTTLETTTPPQGTDAGFPPRGEPPRAFALIAAVLTTAAWLAGCTSAYEREVERARAAARRGDAVEAGKRYRRACELAKDPNASACAYANQIAADVRDRAIAAAVPVCQRGDVRGCVDALSDARTLIGDDAALVSLRETAGRAHARRCQAGAANVPAPVGPVRYARCVAGVRALVDAPGYHQHAAEAGERAAQALDAIAAGAPLADHPGARALLYAASASLTGDAVRGRRRDAAIEAFTAVAAIPVRVRLAADPGAGEPVAADACGAAAARLGARIRCVSAAEPSTKRGEHGPVGPAGIDVAVTVAIGAIRHRAWREEHAVQYQSGVDRQPNPAHDAAQRRVSRAERAVREIERDVAVDKAECEAAERAYRNATGDAIAEADRERARACSRASNMESVFDNRTGELDRARAELDDAPPFVDTPIRDTYQWTTRHQEWHVPFQYHLRAGGPAVTGDGPTVTGDGDVRVHHREQPGFGPADVPALSAGAPPSRRDLALLALERVQPEAIAALERALAARAADRARACPSDAVAWTGAWLECRAEVMLLSRGRISAGELLGLLD